MRLLAPLLAAAALAAAASAARADAVIDWNTRAGDFIAESKMGTPPAVRVMAIVQTAVHQAANEAARTPAPARGVAIEAAVAAANRAALAKLLPAQQAAIANAYANHLATLPEGPARAAGIAAGEKAAEAVLAARSNDGAAGPGEPYRPHAAPGTYVPTSAPAAPHWAKRRPWLMARPDEVRPAGPPPLSSAAFGRDFNEVKLYGSRSSSARSADQTEAARFWEFSLPSIYFGVVRSVAAAPGRDTLQNARLYAATAQAMDDSLIAVFDAKYHYHFWRPATAIRNGDQDGNDATERDAGWTPLIDAPLHPEFPSAHSVLAGAVGAVLQSEVRPGAPLQLATSSPTAGNATRRWSRVEDFMQEVANARVWEGIHFRFSTEAGLAMGRRIGEMAAGRFGGS
jgi:hypothetical protein